LVHQHQRSDTPLLLNHQAVLLRTGFRSHGGQGPEGKGEEEPHYTELQPMASVFGELARGGSYARQGSDSLLKRRSTSVGRSSTQLPQQREGTGRALQTIFSATSLGELFNPLNPLLPGSSMC